MRAARGGLCAARRYYISSQDVSGDGIQTPKLLLVVGGDAATLQWVRDGLDDKDPATLTAVPALVIAESGGAAAGVANGACRLWPEEHRAPCSDGPLALTQLPRTH